MNKFEAAHTVDDIQVLTTRGPWQSKSGGRLEVLFSMSREQVVNFLDYDNAEFAAVQAASGTDIRGLRSYTVSDIPKGSVGGKEWHRARTEYVRAAAGAAMWECIDFQGNERHIALDGTTAVITPPGILHTYRALEDGTELQVVCNTLFVPEDPLTHDTYLRDTFYEMRAEPYLSAADGSSA
ncbi:MAG TPA: hypothetical protein VGO07_04080 [Candidatus Saccharimonadales bacterium]|jgi:dTDP-4-dehydrorhamnose 3,5-epimerase-like enzyme|nr:hypothetical protein [Candidatus Saccharimonadales bacterium]